MGILRFSFQTRTPYCALDVPTFHNLGNTAICVSASYTLRQFRITNIARCVSNSHILLRSNNPDLWKPTEYCNLLFKIIHLTAIYMSIPYTTSGILRFAMQRSSRYTTLSLRTFQTWWILICLPPLWGEGRHREAGGGGINKKKIKKRGGVGSFLFFILFYFWGTSLSGFPKENKPRRSPFYGASWRRKP